MNRGKKITIGLISAMVAGEATIIAASATKNKNYETAIFAAVVAFSGMTAATALCASVEEELVDKCNNLINDYNVLAKNHNKLADDYNDLRGNSIELAKDYTEMYSVIRGIKEASDNNKNEEEDEA